MKTLRLVLQQLSFATGCLLICLPSGYAASGGGTGVGAASAGGGHGGSVAASGARSSGGSVGGARSTGSYGSAFRPAASLNSGIRPGFSGGAAFTRAQSTGYSAYGLRGTSNNAAVVARAVSLVPRVNNAWTDPVEPRGAGAAGIRPAGHDATPLHGELGNGVRTGTTLYPGAPGYQAGNATGGRFQSGQAANRGSHYGHRYYYNNFPYFVSYPFLYNNYGYGGFGDPGYYNDLADYAGTTPNITDSTLGSPDFSSSPNNYYSYAAPAQANPNPAPDNQNPDQGTSPQTLPDAPANVGPQAPPTAEKSGGASQSQGPDTLVEAVQEELSRRGYFPGKPDSMYSEATKEAIRRFQADQHLAVTGRINEATLHALHLD